MLGGAYICRLLCILKSWDLAGARRRLLCPKRCFWNGWRPVAEGADMNITVILKLIFKKVDP